MRAKPAKPGEIYGVPGQGDSLGISAAVIGGLIFVWWLVTWAGWIKPLFLPSPKEVIGAFLDVLQNGFTGSVSGSTPGSAPRACSAPSCWPVWWAFRWASRWA
jgi:hypothetical protein